MTKENEITQTNIGFSMKANKDELPTWTHNINEWFTSLNFTVEEKYINNGHGHQLRYTCEDQKYTFVYYTTGRITIQTNSVEKFRCVFLDNHSEILGIVLREVSKNKEETLNSPLSSTPNANGNLQNNSKPSFSSCGKLRLSNTFDTIREKDTIIKNMNKEIVSLKDSVNDILNKLSKLMDDNEKLRGKSCNINHMNTVNEMSNFDNKKFCETTEKRITTSNININSLQVENKQLREQVSLLNENKTSIENELSDIKRKCIALETVSGKNRTTLIDIEKSLSSEFYATTKILSPPKIESSKITNSEQRIINTALSNNIDVPPPDMNTIKNEKKVETGTEMQRDESATTKKSILDLLVIGSSIVKYIDAKKIEKNNPETSETVCIPGGKIPDILKKLDEMKSLYDIRKLIIHVGANHIPQVDPGTLTQNLSNMYSTIRNSLPNTKIYHSAMLPRNNNGVLHAVNLINNQVERHCQSIRIKSIRHSQFGEREMNLKILRDDRVHPTVNGSSIIAKNIIAVYRNYQRQ